MSDSLRRYALALTGRRDAADDLTQHTLAHLLARAPDKVTHAGYARLTMTRLWLDAERSLRRRLRRYSLVAARSLASHTPADRLTDGELSAALAQRIAALPPLQRAALVMRLIEDMDYEHIAAALDTTVPAVRSSLHQARRMIAAALHEPQEHHS